jgi:hypothetical protein
MYAVSTGEKTKLSFTLNAHGSALLFGDMNNNAFAIMVARTGASTICGNVSGTVTSEQAIITLSVWSSVRILATHELTITISN